MATGEGIRLESIFHPSDFTEASEIAFAHALKLALVAKAELNVLHVYADTHGRWEDYPGVRDTLTRWNLIPAGSGKDAVVQLGIDVRKVVATSKHPVEACLAYLDEEPTDLIVLAVHQNDGPIGWWGHSIGKPMVRKARQVTLFIPHGATGFVSRSDGSVALRNIVIPVTAQPSPWPALEAAARLIHSLAQPPGTVTLLHVGAASEMPTLKTPEGTGWRWRRLAVEGDVVETIVQTASDLDADLIIMPSEGPHGLLEGIRGSTTEQVLRASSCPLLCLPVGSTLG